MSITSISNSNKINRRWQENIKKILTKVEKYLYSLMILVISLGENKKTYIVIALIVYMFITICIILLEIFTMFKSKLMKFN